MFYEKYSKKDSCLRECIWQVLSRLSTLDYLVAWTEARERELETKENKDYLLWEFHIREEQMKFQS